MARETSRLSNMSITGSFLLVSVLFAGCGVNSKSSLSDSSPESEPMIVAMGGYNSCGSEDPKKIMETLQSTPQEEHEKEEEEEEEGLVGAKGSGPRGMGMFRQFNALRNKLRDKFGVESRYIISCFNSGSAAHYRSSASPEELKSVEVKDYPMLISQQMRRGAPIYLIGHSHGGWLSIKNTLALAQEVTIDGLFSSDPISRIYCRPPAIAGCTGFPSDINTAQQEAAKNATTYWLNAWQNKTFYLHSGPSAAADENLKIPAGHTSLDNHDDLWAKIDAKISEKF